MAIFVILLFNLMFHSLWQQATGLTRMRTPPLCHFGPLEMKAYFSGHIGTTVIYSVEAVNCLADIILEACNELNPDNPLFGVLQN